MRTSGLLNDPARAGSADHVCWIYDDDEVFEQAAIRFLAAGLDRGERLLWVGDGAADRLRRAPGRLSAVEDLTARGTLEILPVSAGYSSTRSFSPEEQLAFYDERTRRAVADGYTGLRVVAEVTVLAGDRSHAADFIRWEHLADDYVVHGPGFSAFCAYRSADIDDDVLADAASVHPASSAHGTPPAFRLWFEDQRIVVAGEVDSFGADRFRRLLAGTHVDGDVVTVDLTRLDFIDLGGMRVIAEVAQEVADRGARLVLTGTSRLFRRMWALLDLPTPPDVSFPEPRS